MFNGVQWCSMALDMVMNGVEWTFKQQESRDVSIGHIDLHFLKLEFDPENSLCLKESSLPPFFFLGGMVICFFADEMEHQ